MRWVVLLLLALVLASCVGQPLAVDESSSASGSSSSTAPPVDEAEGSSSVVVPFPSSPPVNQSHVVRITTGSGQVIEYVVEVADEFEEHQRGLMFRERVDEDGGMFFVFRGQTTLNFWMKNTLVPLDIVFIDRDYRILNWVEADPCVADPCPQYFSAGFAKYVLEVNQGQMVEHGVEVGDRVELVAR